MNLNKNKRKEKTKIFSHLMLNNVREKVYRQLINELGNVNVMSDND